MNIHKGKLSITVVLTLQGRLVAAFVGSLLDEKGKRRHPGWRGDRRRVEDGVDQFFSCTWTAYVRELRRIERLFLVVFGSPLPNVCLCLTRWTLTLFTI